MALKQVGLHLAHEIEQHADENQDAGAAEELSHHGGDLQGISEHLRNDGDECEEQRSGKGQPGHGEVQEVSGGFAGTDPGDVTTIALEVFGHLRGLEHGGNPEISEEENEHAVNHPMGGTLISHDSVDPVRPFGGGEETLGNHRWKGNDGAGENDGHHPGVV